MSNDANAPGFGVPGQYYAGYDDASLKKIEQGIANYAPNGDGLGGFTNPLLFQHRQQALQLFQQVKGDKNLDEESRKYLLQQFMSAPASTRLKDTEGKLSSLMGEYRSALEGTDPKFKARVATQKYYETMFDQPGQKQTRGDFSLLMSNVTKR